MTDDERIALADVRDSAQQIVQNKPSAHEHGMQHMGGAETVREDEYKGHKIVIRTRYQIEVDGHPVTGHLGVTNDGRVHYHAVPNLSFPSAVAMVRRLIDAFPDEFPGAEGGHEHPMGCGPGAASSSR
jgi:hypothetical protein